MMKDSKKCDLFCDLLGETDEGVIWLAKPEVYTDDCVGCVNEDILTQSIKDYVQSELANSV